MNLRPSRILVLCAVLSISACVYDPYYYQPTTQQRYDRSWSAAAGALTDQGLTITGQDRGSGVIRGERGGVTVTATVETLADGRVQVKFNSASPQGVDPTLVQRVSDSYDRRMGR
jgi:hypothetical protein